MNSMKKQSVWIFLCLVLLISISGCNQGKTTSGPQGSSLLEDIARKESQTSATYFYLEYRLHAQKDEIPEAIESLEKAIERDKKSAFLKRELIGLYLVQKNDAQALEMAQTLVNQDPENADNLLLLVRLIKPSGQEAQLEGLLKKILTLDPKNKETYLRLGKIYMDNQNSQESLDLFSRMAEQLPDYYVAHFYLGEAHLLMDHQDPAKDAFLKSIELEPELVEPRFRLIEIYEKQGGETTRNRSLNPMKKSLRLNRKMTGQSLRWPFSITKTMKRKKPPPCLRSWAMKPKRPPAWSCRQWIHFFLKNDIRMPSLYFPS